MDNSLIKRQDAIDALCSVCGNDCDKTEFVYNAPQWEQVIMCPEHYALSTLPSAQPKVLACGNGELDAQPEQRWIPCGEQLPEDGLYLVTTSKGQVQVHVFSHNGNSEEYWMRCNKAWMPLPKPYEEGENG